MKKREEKLEERREERDKLRFGRWIERRKWRRRRRR